MLLLNINSSIPGYQIRAKTKKRAIKCNLSQQVIQGAIHEHVKLFIYMQKKKNKSRVRAQCCTHPSPCLWYFSGLASKQTPFLYTAMLSNFNKAVGVISSLGCSLMSSLLSYFSQWVNFCEPSNVPEHLVILMPQINPLILS